VLSLQAGSGKKAIVYFTAKWCPPCKMISPIYDELRYVDGADARQMAGLSNNALSVVRSSQYQDIEFTKIDVDEQAETTSRAGVRVRGFWL
jgi:thiol-disulfide isomerase/thioredoxin